MPPKNAKSAKRRGKLSKAERERLKREENERRQQEEEEAQRQAEKEEQERLERERKLQEELQRIELKDQDRREGELNELRYLLEQNQMAVTKWKTDVREKAKWERYMRCDGSPDPSEQKDINTYISLWKDDPEVDITPVLKQCALALQLIEELEGVQREVREPAEGQQYQETILSLQELIHSKHLLTTEEILKRASISSDIETGNMQTVVKDENITLCLWANLSKNPRLKVFQFEEAGVGFELPKQLAVSNIAVRILHTIYDHLTPLASMVHLRGWTPNRRSLGGGEEVPPQTDSSEQVETEVKQESGETSVQIRGAGEDTWSVQESAGREHSAVSIQSGRGSIQKTVGDPENQIQTQIEGLSEDSDCAPMEVVVDGTESIQVVDLLQYTPLGGVFYWDVFHLPPQAKKIGGWEIRQLLDTGLQAFPYPMEQSQIKGPDCGKMGDSGLLTCPPVGVSITLSDSVLFLEQPHVARWDAMGKQWRMDGISDISYDEPEARIIFKMDAFHAFVLMQDTYVNFPFQSWELRPLGQDSALLSINAALVDLNITIQGDQCMLQSKQEKGLSHLLGKWMSGPTLQRAMTNAGINIFVNEYTDKYVSSYGKDPLTEHATYEQMALLSCACAFSWSQWNAKCGLKNLVMQVCEHEGPSSVPKNSWSVYLLGAQRSQRLKMKEKDEIFSPELHPGSEFHSTFIHMLQDNVSPEGMARTHNTHYLFINTVQNLLCATRLLNYS